MSSANALVLICLLTMLSCSEGDDARPIVPWHSQAPGLETRRTIATTWDTLWSVGGSLNDTVLLYSGQIASSDSMLAVLEYQSNRLTAFDFDGNVLWTFGRKGRGPGELSSARDIAFVTPNRLAVLDPGNAKIVEVDREGESTRSISLRLEYHVEEFVPLSTGQYLIQSMAPRESLILIDQHGEVSRRWSWPWAELEELHVMLRQGFTAADGDRWIFALTRVNGWFAYQDTAPLSGGRSYLESLPLPEVSIQVTGDRRISRISPSQSACSGCAVSLSDGRLYVLYGGTGPLARYVVDVFDWRTGSYEYSYRLPYRATSIAVAKGHFFILSTNPYPMLQALAPHESGRHGSALPQQIPAPSRTE